MLPTVFVTLEARCGAHTDNSRFFSIFLTSRGTSVTIVEFMQLVPQSLLIAAIAVAALCEAGEKSSNNARVEKYESSDVANTTFRTAEAIKAMPARAGIFVKRLSEFSGAFRAADGKEFVLGSSDGDQAVWHFVSALKVGGAYQLPDAFVNYLAARHYGSASEIAAMTPCTATVAARSPCSSTFMTTDGKWLSIGDPGS